jgi:FlaA1/EpsC-like NDP-sugar epimerase
MATGPTQAGPHPLTLAVNQFPAAGPLPVRRRGLRIAQYAIDTCLLSVAFLLAYLLRFDFEIPYRWLLLAIQQLPLALLVQWSVLYMSGAYSFVWRYVGMTEAKAFARAGAIATAILVALRLGAPTALISLRIPLSVILIDGVLAFAAVLGIRTLRRVIHEEQQQSRRRAAQHRGLRPKVLLIGAGGAGVMAVREISGRGDLDLDVRGFVDDDPLKRDAVISGMRVLGTCDDLPRLVEEHDIDHVIITVTDAPRESLQRIIGICDSIPIRAQRIPALYDVLQGKVEISRFRTVRPEDLLDRDVATFDERSLERFLGGKTVMVTGAGGSIGSELVRQVARYAPARIVLVERAEFAMFEIDREVRRRWPSLEFQPVVADVGDAVRMNAVLASCRPQVIAHAAAHKHVPLMELNATDAVRNNIFGTLTLAELAGQHGVETFVMISTDKAVRPSSVMGASKRMAELVVQDLGRRFPTRFFAVRFGNVLGSAGSVIPTFREQIARGGPVTITHPDMRRYFMTIPEACVLVLEAAAMGKGGEIFVLEMGEPVRILDMARRMIELSGYEPDKDIEIVFTGVRPGEKLFEELESSEETIARTAHPKINIGRIAGRSSEDIAHALERLRALCTEGRSDDEVRTFLAGFLPDSEMAQGSRSTVA